MGSRVMTHFFGIASKLPPTADSIRTFDKNAIMYYPYGKVIYKHTTKIESKTILANGDEIHFRFQPEFKKFSISLVSSIMFT